MGIWSTGRVKRELYRKQNDYINALIAVIVVRSMQDNLSE